MSDFKSKEKIPRDVKRGWSPFTKIFIAVACIILFGVFIQAIRESKQTISKSEITKSRQHLEDAKKAINAGRIAEAKYHLEAMNKHSREWNSEGKALWDKIGTFITEEKKAADRQKKEQTITLRGKIISVNDTHDDVIAVLKNSDMLDQTVHKDPNNPNSLLTIRHYLVGEKRFTLHFARVEDPGPYRVVKIIEHN